MLRFLDKTENYIGKTTAECRIKIGKSDSNIADLINDQMRSRKTFNPRGWLSFTEAVKEINVPNDLIGNPRRLHITTGSTVGKRGKGKDVRKWLTFQDTCTLHKSFPRRRVLVHGIEDQGQIDLVDLSSLSRVNDDYTFLLTCIDVISKYAWVCL